MKSTPARYQQPTTVAMQTRGTTGTVRAAGGAGGVAGGG